MKPDGAVNVFPVDRDPTSFFQSFTVWPHKAIPNGLGGVLVAYDIRYYFAFTYHQARLRLVNADGTIGGGSALGGTSTLGSWGPRLGRDGGDLVLGEEWVKATSYRTIGSTTVARITDFTRVASSGLDVFLDGGDLPGFTALEGGEFFASYADGTTSGPDPDHTSVQLANAIYTGGGSFFGSAEGAVTSRVGGALEVANTEWAAQAGGQQSANSSRPITVTNSYDSPILIKLGDGDGRFRILQRNTPFYDAVDGVKSDLWRASPADPQFSGDWFKVNGGFGVVVSAAGVPSRTLLSSNYLLLGLPECDFGESCWFAEYLASTACPKLANPTAYDCFGGRKKEPDWSDVRHPDWKYIPPPQ